MYDSKWLMIDWLLEYTKALQIVNMTRSLGIRPASFVETNSSSFTPDVLCITTKPHTESIRRLRFFVDVLSVPLFVLFGLVGNALSVAVLRKMSCCSTTSLLLQALAVADSVFLVTCVGFQCLEFFYYFFQRFREAVPVFPYVLLVIWPVAGIAQMTGVWLVVLVTVERYVAVCHPLMVKRVMTMTKTRLAIATIFAFVFLFNVPTFFDLETRLVKCEENREELVITVTRLSLYHPYQLVYKTILCFIFRTALPLCVVVYCNVRLVSAVRTSSKSFSDSRSSGSSARAAAATAAAAEPSQQKQGDDLNTITIFLVAVFVACELPDAFCRALMTVKFYVPSLPLSWVEMWVIGIVTNFLLTINSSVNVVIYAVTGKRFRYVLLHSFCRKRSHLRPSNV